MKGCNTLTQILDFIRLINNQKSVGTLCSESGAAAAVLPVTTDFLLFITLLKSIICVKELHPLIILSMPVQSVLIPSVLFRPGEWYSCTLNNERLEYLNINFGFQNSDKQQKVCRNQEVSSCCSTFRAQCRAPLFRVTAVPIQ